MCRDTSCYTRLLKILFSPALNWAELLGLGHPQLPWATGSSISPNFPFQFAPIGPCPTTTVAERVALRLPCRPPSDTRRLQCILLFSGLNSPNFVSLSSQGICSHPLCGPPLDLLQQSHVLLILGIPELYAVFQGVSQKPRS